MLVHTIKTIPHKKTFHASTIMKQEYYISKSP